MKQQIRFQAGGRLSFRPTLDGAEIFVQTPTVLLERSNATELVASQDATLGEDGELSVEITADQASLSSPEANLRATWTYTYGGREYVQVDLFDVVRFPLYSVVSDTDLKRDMGKISTVLYPMAETTYEDTISLAFEEIYARIEQMGRRPWLVLESGQLKLAHSALCLARIYGDQSQGDDVWRYRAKEQRDRYEALMDGLPIRYDANDGGTISPAEEGSSWGSSTIERI